MHVHFTSGAQVLFTNWLACDCPVLVLNDMFGLLLTLFGLLLPCNCPECVHWNVNWTAQCANVLYIFYILYTPYPSTLAKSPSQSWSPQEFYMTLRRSWGLYSDPQMRLRPGFALASLPQTALTSAIRVPFTLQVTCDPEDSIVAIPPSKGVIHGSCGSNLRLLCCCCYAAMLLCCGIPIFAPAPAPQLLKHYVSYTITI